MADVRKYARAQALSLSVPLEPHANHHSTVQDLDVITQCSVSDLKFIKCNECVAFDLLCSISIFT